MKKTVDELMEIYNEGPAEYWRALEVVQDSILEGMMPIPEAVGFDEWNEGRNPLFTNPRDVWQAAHGALLASGQYINVPPVDEWPANVQGVTLIWDYNIERKTAECIETIPRPQPSWEPKYGEWVWRVEYQAFSVIRYSKGCEGSFFASVENFVEESTWTREQFRQRGRFLEVK